MVHWYSVACNYLSTISNQVDGECRHEHCWERHHLISQMGRDGGQEDIDGDHRRATHTDKHLGWYSRNKLGGEEGIHRTNNRQRQILKTDLNKTVSANGLDIDIID